MQPAGLVTSRLLPLVLPCSSLTRASLCCCCRAAALCWARRVHSHFAARAHPDASPRTPRTDRLWTWLLARFLCASHGFLCALYAAGALHWPDCLAYAIALAHTLLCAAWLFLQRRLCAHLPHWRVLCWRLCAECFLLPCDGLQCRWIERAAAVLLEREHSGGKRCSCSSKWSIAGIIISRSEWFLVRCTIWRAVCWRLG